MSRKLAVCIAGASALATFVLLARPANASPSVTGLQSGYWWEAESTGTSIPPPPSVPAGGLWVSSTASGPQAISALRFNIPDGSSNPVVVLKVHQAQPASQVAVWACPASSAWEPPKGAGTWAKRPTANCQSDHVAGAMDASGSRMTFHLAALTTGNTVDVVLTPGALPTPAAGTPPVSPSSSFDATFEALTPSDVVLSQTASSQFGSGSPTGFQGAVAVPTAPSVPSSPPVAPVAPGPATGMGGVAVPAPSALPAGSTSPGRTPSLASGPATAPGNGSSLPTASLPVVLAGHRNLGRSWRDRALLAFMLVDLAAYGLFLAHRSQGGRPKLTLYDAPPLRSERKTPREGMPPALR